MKVLRAFLGVTFAYAGIQKLSDPNFFRRGSFDYIGSQITSFANGSPIGPLLRLADHFAILTGAAFALAEILVGLGTLSGIGASVFAAGGFVISLTLFLSASWHVHPYFLGSDSMYAVAWLAYFLGLLEIRRRGRRNAESAKAQGHAPRDTSPAPAGIGRRELLRGTALAGATLVVAGAATALAGSPSPASGIRSGRAGGSNGAGSVNTATNSVIASLSSIPVGQAVGFNAPEVGPAALIRLGQSDVVAYSRVCTHAGCLVGYDSTSHLLVCPCHGSEFDPARNAEVIRGPAPTPLPPVSVAIDRKTGEVVITS
jgi:thiosulfate dehydrogenase [quinone] large subunit